MKMVFHREFPTLHSLKDSGMKQDKSDDDDDI